MAKVQTIGFTEFMDGSWKTPKISNKDLKKLTSTLIKAGCMVPLALSPTAVFAEGAGEAATKAVASTSLSILAHALDPIVQILVAISLPVASVVMIGGCFFFMFGNSEKAWNTIQHAGLGYILIQLSPLFIRVLEQVGKSL
ncbi:hypothetical protein [Aneurinibacillus migulanus]|uniref:TrbC/VIRB2 family protein n=1 Tax=Aneurinibacillus migulanus TaxID=47500 RepID=A0A0D1VL96_ANEMI|nr:hypothetical protein [Aneurinibacillus migulanus]KIV60334.1 hypothetical protein TS65_00745 [Aneurinibacillus migulanus]KON90465.1 hypothetical protein AF333_28670 [Aneurinibacillus migulanus]MED0894863.1 hypothetical protein [Aneurinibacillus migulanus]MED1614386.1 hypothetical protein [Aneurinibacillus migulanus]SDJ79362.1 hypothetical protein SAMN04487909_128102 [Aneurinibacillus migulanus]